MVFPPLINMIDLTMNLISKIHNKCERKEHHIAVLQEYLRITRFNELRRENDSQRKIFIMAIFWKFLFLNDGSLLLGYRLISVN